jgi:hypothetical protein
MANNKQAPASDPRINITVPRGLRTKAIAKSHKEGLTLGKVVVALLKGYVGV